MWPDANEFEITCPQSYTNVQAVSLSQISLPDIYYNFSDELENTKIHYSINEAVTDLSLTIPNGSYTYNNLATILTNKMSGVEVRYSSLQHKFVFLGDENLKLNFHFADTYDVVCSKNKKNIPYHRIKWGLAYFLGFQKVQYTTSDNDTNDPDSPLYGYKDFGTVTTDKLNNFGISHEGLNNYIASQFPIPSAFYKHTIYMELDKMNNIDELKPYVNNTTSLCNYDYNGMINSAFAKIVYRNINNTFNDKINWETIYDNKNNKAIITFDPPLEKLNKFKVKFRLHDGTDVDFLNNEINFTLDLILLKNEIARSYNIRVPPVYTF